MRSLEKDIAEKAADMFDAAVCARENEGGKRTREKDGDTCWVGVGERDSLEEPSKEHTKLVK